MSSIVRDMMLSLGLSEHDQQEIAKFETWLGLEKSRRAGGDPAALNVVEQVLYPEGIGRAPIDGQVEA